MKTLHKKTMLVLLASLICGPALHISAQSLSDAEKAAQQGQTNATKVKKTKEGKSKKDKYGKHKQKHTSKRKKGGHGFKKHGHLKGHDKGKAKDKGGHKRSRSRSAIGGEIIAPAIIAEETIKTIDPKEIADPKFIPADQLPVENENEEMYEEDEQEYSDNENGKEEMYEEDENEEDYTDDAGDDYWEVRNNTGSDLTVNSDSETITINKDQTAKLDRDVNTIITGATEDGGSIKADEDHHKITFDKDAQGNLEIKDESDTGEIRAEEINASDVQKQTSVTN